MYKVTKIINQTCKKLEINYKSPNYREYKNYRKDIETLSDIYLQLKIIIGDLYELKEKYPELENELNVDIFDLDKTDHHIIAEVRKIIKRRKQDEEKN